MKTCTAIAATFMRIESSMSTAISSLDNSLSILVPPEARMTMAFVIEGGTTLRKIPRVNISVSAYGASGMMLTSIRSSPVVAP